MASGMVTPKTPARKRSRQTLQPLKIPPSPFLESLGFGTGVNVWKLKESKSNSCQNSPWAIKNVRRNMSKALKNKYENLISKEANMLRSLCHENIIGFRDVITSEDGRKCLAMELGGESLGNMIEERFENMLGPYPANLILNVIKNVANALAYLHDEKNILHGDIKSYNIVVKNNFEVIKLCDFGVSINLDENGVAHGFVGTPIYSAPECQEGAEGPVTCKADIFSLGLVIWEMIALVPPHTEVGGSEDESEYFSSCDSESEMDDSYISEADSSVVKYGTRPNLPDVKLGDEYSNVIEIFYCCTEQDPNKRPTAHYLVQHLSTLV
ncbi:UNVERIFIED_CONTAM: hypothetical protein PYX00_005546 [Menopon gallinae]|uniref:Protein kinase domain-containing protein n=1 Tax=Menopon gallinae TaxID=328185 RepID=A0AAW2HRV7_9NEOP